MGLWDAALSFFQNLFFPIHCFVRHKKGEKESLLAENSVRVRRSHMWDLKPLLTPDLLFLYAETQFPCARLGENSISVPTTTSKYTEHHTKR